VRVVVANKDFFVVLRADYGKNILVSHRVVNGEEVKVLSDRMEGVIKLDNSVCIRTQVVSGYLVEIEGQTVFIDCCLLNFSGKKDG
jgi:hypothetical protein